MGAVPEEIRGSAAASQQKGDRREISLRRVTQLACEDEIVAPIVGGLAAAGGDMIEGHRRLGKSVTAVRAYRAMLLQEPPPSFGVGDASRRMRGELDRAVRRASFGALLSPPTAGARGTRSVAMLVLEQLLLRPQMRSRAM
jgi:hypothetical protein